MPEQRTCGNCSEDGRICEWAEKIAEDGKIVCGLDNRRNLTDCLECMFHQAFREQKEKNECLAYQLNAYKELWWEALSKISLVQGVLGPFGITKKGEEIVLELPKNFCIKGKDSK